MSESTVKIGIAATVRIVAQFPTLQLWGSNPANPAEMLLPARNKAKAEKI